MDKEYIYLLFALLLSFSIGLGVILMAPNDFQRLEKGWEVPFTMPVYQETGLSKYPIKGYFKRKNGKLYHMYLNNKFDSEFKVNSSTEEMIILSNELQEMRLKFKKGDLIFVVQRIYENQEKGIKPMDIVYPQ